MEPESLWILVSFVSTEPQWELLSSYKTINPTGLGPTVMTSFNFNYILKAHLQIQSHWELNFNLLIWGGGPQLSTHSKRSYRLKIVHFQAEGTEKTPGSLLIFLGYSIQGQK